VTTGLPVGFRIALDPDTKHPDDLTVHGGTPMKVMRLSPSGLSAWTELQQGPVHSHAAGVLARRLTDAGLAHPRAPVSSVQMTVTVVIPVRDRSWMLDRCLHALGSSLPVVGVDDGSVDSQSVAAVVTRHGARLVALSMNRGPAVARNAGLDAVTTEVVAFLDSDCIPQDGWLERLLPHLADPLVAAVAPRIVALASTTSAGRYSAANGGLDLGDREAMVAPATRVTYVPTAALVARRAALMEMARGNEVFDSKLRYGEDVDLIWRLHEAGWRIRYDPSVHVMHQEPDTWGAHLRRRFHYGTSAAPLTHRHPDATAPLVLHPWPTLTVAAALGWRPTVAGLSFVASVLSLRQNMRRAQLPATDLSTCMLKAALQTWLGIGRYSTQFAAPMLIAAVLSPSGSKRRFLARRHIAAASLLVGSPMTTWLLRRPALDPLRFALGHIADDIAYGTGVWAGCVHSRTMVPLKPRVSWRPTRFNSSLKRSPRMAADGSHQSVPRPPTKEHT
jgi:mycofactocin system glycosyltransferase